jgi:hypothetical protein
MRSNACQPAVLVSAPSALEMRPNTACSRPPYRSDFPRSSMPNGVSVHTALLGRSAADADRSAAPNPRHQLINTPDLRASRAQRARSGGSVVNVPRPSANTRLAPFLVGLQELP